MVGGWSASRHLETGGSALFCLVLARVGCGRFKGLRGAVGKTQDGKLQSVQRGVAFCRITPPPWSYAETIWAYGSIHGKLGISLATKEYEHVESKKDVEDFGSGPRHIE